MIEAQELGRSIYNGIIRAPLSDPQNYLSYETIMYKTFAVDPSERLPKSHIVEVIAGILFGAELAISEKFHFDTTMDKINEGIIKEMSYHLKEFDFEDLEIDDLISHCYSRVDEYFEMFTASKDSGVVLVIGKHFYWNVIGREEITSDLLFSIVPSAVSKIVFAQKCVRQYLNEFKVV